MASLTEVYDGRVRTVADPRRVYLGSGVFVAGVSMLVASIVIATTTLGQQAGLSLFAGRELAGVLAGLGLPTAFLGVFTVLPSGRLTKATAVIGASVSVFGIALFTVAYPYQWFAGGAGVLAVGTVVVYFAGVMTTLSCLFAALATFKTRSDPGGTAKMEITEEGSIHLVEDADPLEVGSVGLFGTDPEGTVSTQTNRESPPPSPDDRDGTGGAHVLSDDTGLTNESNQDSYAEKTTGSTDRTGSTGPGATPTADGGSAAVGTPDPADSSFLDAASERGKPDPYCGNCEHFEYVKVNGEIVPYCGFTEEQMDDMDACRHWEEN